MKTQDKKILLSITKDLKKKGMERATSKRLSLSAYIRQLIEKDVK
jgi:predicted HicB family RNase H-like nuclease